MKGILISLFIWTTAASQDPPKMLLMEAHHKCSGKVSVEDVVRAHAKDLTVEKKYGMQFLKCWLDKTGGTIYCLSATVGSRQLIKAHAAAYVLLADQKILEPENNYLLPNRGKYFCPDGHDPWPGNNAHKLLPVYIVKLKSVQ